MTAWLPSISPATRTLLAEALRRTGNEEQAAFLCDGANDRTLRAVRTRLARFERVQLMAKARFFTVLDGGRDEALRRQLEAYWHRSYG